MTHLVAVIVAIMVIVAMLYILTRGVIRANIQGLESDSLRAVQGGMALWSKNNKNLFPLPSVLDASNHTISGVEPETKDTTANIVSILIYNGYISPDRCVSVRENNKSILVDDDYEYTEPQSAADGSLALWDPAFSTNFTAGQIGNLSYALAAPAGAERRRAWRDTADPAQAVASNRGPEITSVTRGLAPKVTPSLRTSRSNTLRSADSDWIGIVVYNDGQARRQKSMFGAGPSGPLTYTDAAGVTWNDLLFLDEPDDAAGTNNYLGNFIKAGKGPADFTAIWD